MSIFIRVVHIGFKNRQKVDYLRRYWLFSNVLFWFTIFSWRFIFSENLACARLLFQKIDFLSMVFIYRLKSLLDMNWVVQKNSGFLFLSMSLWKIIFWKKNFFQKYRYAIVFDFLRNNLLKKIYEKCWVGLNKIFSWKSFKNSMNFQEDKASLEWVKRF